MSERILVIGGSSNLGLAAARRLSESGREVTIAGRDESRLEAAATSLGGVDTAVLDVTDPEAVADLFSAQAPFDHVVVTAATLPYGPFLQSSEQDVRPAFDSRVWGAYNVARHGAARLAERGSMTFFSGIINEAPVPGTAMTAASCGAIEALTRSLAVELAPLRFNTIAPGYIGQDREDPVAEQAAEHLRNALPARRIGRPEDVALAVEYVIGNGFVTGTTLQVNGGHHLAR